MAEDFLGFYVLHVLEFFDEHRANGFTFGFAYVPVCIRKGEDAHAMGWSEVSKEDIGDIVRCEACTFVEASCDCFGGQGRVDEDVHVAGANEGCCGMRCARRGFCFPYFVNREGANTDDAIIHVVLSE